MRYTVTAEQDGMTVKEFLFGNLGFSRAAVTRLKKRDGGITVGGKHATVRNVLRSGDELVLLYEDGSEDVNGKILPVPMKLDILYEDGNVIACGKPPFQPTHPSHGHYDDTLANGLAAYFVSRGIPFVFRAVCRLDADTSGVVLVAKNKPSAAALSRQLAAHKLKKEYIAVLRGTLESDEGEICGNIGRIEQSVIFREVKHDGSGAYALTRYRVLHRYELFGRPYTAVLAEPVTGRTHQLRVHFDSIGHTILGDRLYPVSGKALKSILRSREQCGEKTAEMEICSGGIAAPAGIYGVSETYPDDASDMRCFGDAGAAELIRRQALHAAAISFELPDGGRIRVRSPLPDDILSVLPEHPPKTISEYIF